MATANRSPNCSIVVARPASTPKSVGQLQPIHVGAAEIEHVERGAARVLHADIAQLVEQDRVFAVGEDHRGDVELLARLRPERLHRVERRSVSLQIDDTPPRRPDRGAGRERHAAADRPAFDLHPVMRCGIDGIRVESETRR